MKWFDDFIVFIIICCIIFLIFFLADFIEMELKYHIIKYVWRDILP